MRGNITKRRLYIIVAICSLVLIGLIIPAMALEGPVANPPSGVFIIDSDPGAPNNAEQWGRVGGRTLTFTFTNAQIVQYDELRWSPVSVEIAFDNAVDEFSEVLTGCCPNKRLIAVVLAASGEKTL